MIEVLNVKKYIVLIALIAVTGCGGADKDKKEITTIETTTVFEYDTETELATEATDEGNEEETEKFSESETKAENESSNKGKESEETLKSESFEKSDTYASLKGLASNAGFDISYDGNTVTFKTYITDDTIDYIKEKDESYHYKWDENCGLYEEFCSEAMRTVKNNGVADINIALEVLGRSDNQVYYRNENGTSIYDAYVHENQL